MAEMGFIPQLGCTAIGGVGAAIADRKFSDKTWTLGPITFTVGALGSIAGLLIMSFAGGKSLPWQIFGHAVMGATIYEATEIGQEQAVPLLEKFFPGWLSPALPGGEPAAGEDYVSGYLDTGLPCAGQDDFDPEDDLAQGLGALRGMC